MWDKRSDERHYFSIMADEFVATGTAGDEEWHLEGTFHNLLDFNSLWKKDQWVVVRAIKVKVYKTHHTVMDCIRKDSF
jgi:hypothetical protein